MVGTILFLVAMSLLSNSTISCDGSVFSYHWFILDALDLFQSLLIMFSAMFLVKHLRLQLKQQNENDTNDVVSLEERKLRCLSSQTKMIAGFYLSYVIFDLVF